MHLNKIFKMMVTLLIMSHIPLFAKSNTSHLDIVENWDVFDNLAIKKPSKGLSSVVVFRTVNSVSGPAVNLYIDGEYQASLLSGAYTQTFVCPGTHRFSVAYTNVLTRYKAKKRVDLKSKFVKEHIAYYEIAKNSNNKLTIRPLSEEKALVLIKKLPPRQRHTISRLNKRQCRQGSK